MRLAELNALAAPEAFEAFERCCGARRWAEAMVAARPYADAPALYAHAEAVWAEMTREDILEAFRHHPMIGDVESLRQKFASTAAWASNEQAGTAVASEETLEGLAAGNAEYLARFGYIFIICATGKPAEEMLASLRARLPHDPETELGVAAGQQALITRLRLEKMLT